MSESENIKANVAEARTEETRPFVRTVKGATRQEIEQPKRENGELKHLVADLSLQVHRLKQTSIPMLNDAVGTRG